LPAATKLLSEKGPQAAFSNVLEHSHVATEHQLSSARVHYTWDNGIPPQLSLEPGDTLIAQTRDSADRYYSADSSHADVARKGPLQGHPLTGPVFVRGAEPGDTLIVDILDVTPTENFGWTAIRPGKGLLPGEEFPRHFLQIWDLSDTHKARMPQRRDIAVPIAPFPGIVGTALAVPGPHSTIPPRENGGNMDIKHLTRGARLYLPVSVPGALFSIGDAHAAQGDGEVCVTAIEMSATMRLRIDLLQGRSPREPCMRTSVTAGDRGTFFATTAHGPDLHECARRATRYLIDHLVEERGLSREQAYVLCSVCADLKITQIVDAPHWSVAAFFPEAVFV
jgi:acetamidase/formamidase